MGLSVWNQVNSHQYFSISTIDAKELSCRNIQLSVSKFKEIVKKTPPHSTLITGSDRAMGHRRSTNIYRYDDFAYLAT